MNIYTIITKKSIREILKERKFLKFYSLKNLEKGQMFEVIDGNKKSPAIVLKKESVSDMKEILRNSDTGISKLKLSKTGDFKDGKIIDFFTIDDIKNYLKNPDLVKESENKNIKNFFPKKKKIKEEVLKNKDKKVTKNKEAQSISDLLKSKNYLKKHKVYHSEMQEMVDTIRTYFSEKNVFGIGSFPYYIGMFKQVPKRDIYQFFGEAKQSRRAKSVQKRIF
jgi:ribosomal protein L14E/L6E/L27E